VTELLEELASSGPTPGGGSVAALVVAMAAGLVAMAARASEGWSEAAGAIAQAESLRRRATPLVERDATVYAEALRVMREPPPARPEERDDAIALALARAAEVPLEITDLAADTAALAVSVARRGSDAARPDAAAAAVLSAAAAQAAANLVAVNLAATSDDRLVARAARRAAEAADATRGILDLPA
jgi:formiminotetrahydrofolate cyclodeaminase